MPKYYVYKSSGGSDHAYLKQMGYQETPEDERSTKGPWESTDDFLFRSEVNICCSSQPPPAEALGTLGSLSMEEAPSLLAS